MDVDTYYQLRKIEGLVETEAEENKRFREDLKEFIEDIHAAMIDGEALGDEDD